MGFSGCVNKKSHWNIGIKHKETKTWWWPTQELEVGWLTPVAAWQALPLHKWGYIPLTIPCVSHQVWGVAHFFLAICILLSVTLAGCSFHLNVCEYVYIYIYISTLFYPLVIQHNYGQVPFLTGKSSNSMVTLLGDKGILWLVFETVVAHEFACGLCQVFVGVHPPCLVVFLPNCKAIKQHKAAPKISWFTTHPLTNLPWLVVSTPLKNISQLGLVSIPSIYGKIKNVPNHLPTYL